MSSDPLDHYPTIDDLVDGVRTGSTTDLWDVVVSISVEKLNGILHTLWITDSTTTNVKVTTTSLDQFEQPFYIDWDVKLGSPSLSFTLDGKSSLTMSLSGTHQVQGKNPNTGEEMPIIPIPENSYVLVATVPLVAVKAVEGDTAGTDPTNSDQVISFDDNPDAKLHVVFQFNNEGSSQYRIDYTGSGDDPSGDQISIGLREKLADWMMDPKNINAITYSLAVVEQTPSVDTQYLTPESMSFSIYASSTKTVGCLSVYIKTKDSDYPVGNQQRAFHFPKTNQNSYPIPDGYDASISIIIRRNNFSKFLNTAIHNTRESSGKEFEYVNENDTQTGFSFTIALNDDLVAFMKQQILGGSPQQSRGTHTDVTGQHFGDVFCKIVVDKTIPLMQTDQTEIRANISMSNGDYRKTTRKEGDEGWPEPGQVIGAFNSWELPTFSGDFGLDFFATTNIFAPGKQIIDIDTKRGVLTPYDVLLVGHIKDDVRSAVKAGV
ncbi:hypothetical protein SERLADRAFT_415769 [Serpula lacrymans var. lacrymans S7.9]|uniref:Uncharacterized protein n=1 Tax=Serpula lacrymans var. lacrymans (strain S7.9) TaxID=578457 RepID=F8NY45_SERL9|nr:uncharacterized protein SERLADRAFT_415769 [Serpula lacrymans var. lacrymans S7.9]EGO24807.1 hypothetical protein SERLADRAFT_415769 [Serpula lacrymans var. lacrymans S7.9]